MLEVECQILIKRNGVCFLGPTKVELLQEIKDSGSLSQASKKMKISYQHAWTIVDEMNKAAPEPLVVKQRGGANGGGAVLSSYGEMILTEYFIIRQQFLNLAKQINVDINI